MVVPLAGEAPFQARERSWAALRTAGAAYLVARLIGSIAAAIAIAGIPALPPVAALGYAPAPKGPIYNLTIGAWERWDAIWIIRIAEHGYSAGTQGSGFFPLLPLSIRALHALGLPSLVAALLVTNACFLAALYFTCRLAEIDLGIDAARRAVWLQALYPGSLFCLAPYTEAPYLALVTAAMYAARTRRWWLAGALAGAASGTRIVGVLLLPALVVEFVLQRRESPKVRWRDALALILAPSGLVLFSLYWNARTGDPLEYLHQLNAWGRVSTPPWTTLRMGLQQASAHIDQYPHAVFWLEAGAAVALLAVGIVALRLLRPTYSAFLWLSVVPLFVNPAPIRVFVSLLRYSAVLFPAGFVLATMMRRASLNEAVRLVFAGTFAVCTAMFVTSNWML